MGNLRPNRGRENRRYTFEVVNSSMIAKLNLFYIFAAVVAIAFHPICHAQITLDGTVGPGVAQDLTPIGATFDIPANLGTTAGNNLLHSFGEFNLTAGQIANFSGPGNIANIISRVTGGNVSNIDGTLRSTIAGANFFFVNPAGVIFGPTAQLDVSGSFVVSTADELRLADGQVFSAVDPTGADNVLLSAPPSAFGFLNANPAPVQINGSVLSVPPGESFSVVGGDISIEGGVGASLPNPTVLASDGRIEIISVASAGQATIPLDGTSPVVDSFAELGNATLTQGAVLNVTGLSAGTIAIRSGHLVLQDNSVLGTLQFGNADAAPIGIDINVRQSLVTHGASFQSFALGGGRNGDVKITAGVIDLHATGIFLINLGPSDGADLTVQAEQLMMADSTKLIASTLGPARGGNVTISANQIVIDSLGATPGLGESSIAAQTVAAVNGGDAGDIQITTDSLNLLNGSLVNASTRGSGQAGNIHIIARTVSLQNTNTPTSITHINAESLFGSTGNTGNITIETDSLDLSHASVISISNTGPGTSGLLDIQADHISLIGDGINTRAEIKANAGGSGDSGDIHITTKTLEIFNGAAFDLGTTGSGDGGSLRITASESIRIGEGTQILTGIGAATLNPVNGGKGGSIHIVTGSLELTDSTTITSLTEGAGAAGTVTIEANDVSIDDASLTSSTLGAGAAGTVTIKAVDVSISNDGVVSSSSGDTAGGDAGRVNITAARNVRMSEGGIVRTFATQTNGGDVAITAGDAINMFDSTISAEAALDGGNIKLTAPNLVRIVRSTITGQAGQDGGQISIDPIFVILDQSIIDGRAGGQPVFVSIDPNAIFLSSQSQILTTSVSLPPELDLSGSLVQLPESLLNDISQLSETCAIKLQGEFSSFIVVGRGGMPVDPGSAIPSFHLSTHHRGTDSD